MMTALKQVALLTGKDLRIELRTHQTLGLVIVLGILIVVVLGVGLGSAGEVREGFQATAVLWVAYLFAGVLCFEKTMAVERHDGALAGLLLAPIDRGLIFVGKLLGNLVLMLILAAVITPTGILLLGFDLSAAPGGFALVTLLGMVGFAAVGTLFAAAVSSSRLRGGLLALVVFPLCLPVVLTSSRLMVRMFTEGQGLEAGGLGILAAFDVVYLVVSWLVFEKALTP